MKAKATNRQLFALAAPPAQRLVIAGGQYRLARVFKHDFFAATSLYENVDDNRGMGDFGELSRAVPPVTVIPRVVVKIYRDQGFCGLGLAWLGRLSRDHELASYRALAGVAGVPRCLGPVAQTGLAIEYIDAKPLDQHVHPQNGWHAHASAVCAHGRGDALAPPMPPIPAGFFDALRDLFAAVHGRGVAYVDANKLSNILIDRSGRPWLIDFQIALRRRDDLPWPVRTLLAALVSYLQQKDLYHLYKHKRRLAPQELTAQEEALSRRRGGWHGLHRSLTKPYRGLRRLFLRRQHQSGRLISPTAKLEDHYQPEKQTWRKER